MSQNLPYRTTPRTLSHEELAELNAQRKLRGEPPLASAEEEQFEIELTVRASPADIQRWLTHPDERVFLAYLRRIADTDRVESLTGLHVRDAHSALVRAAIDRANADGLVWTPLIAAAYHQSAWHMAAAAGNPLEGVPTPWEYSERLAPWLGHERDSAALAGLLEFEAPLLLHRLALSGKHLSLELVDTLVKKGCLVSLCKNSALTGPALEWVVRMVILMNDSAGDAPVEALNRRGVGVSDRVLRATILDPAFARANRGMGFGLDTVFPRIRTLLKLECLTLDQLQAIRQCLDTSGRDVVMDMTWHRVAMHPNADLTLIRQAYQAIPAGREQRTMILDAFADSPAVLSDPFFRDQYRRHENWAIRLVVADDLADEEFDALIQEIMQRGRPSEICGLLKAPERRIPYRVIEALLNHPSREVRILAISRLSATEASSPTPQPGKSPTRLA